MCEKVILLLLVLLLDESAETRARAGARVRVQAQMENEMRFRVSEMAHLENGIISWSPLTGLNRLFTEINEACRRVLGVETRHKEVSCPG